MSDYLFPIKNAKGFFFYVLQCRRRQLSQCLENTTGSQENHRDLFRFTCTVTWQEASARTTMWVTLEKLCTIRVILNYLVRIRKKQNDPLIENKWSLQNGLYHLALFSFICFLWNGHYCRFMYSLLENKRLTKKIVFVVFLWYLDVYDRWFVCLSTKTKRFISVRQKCLRLYLI